MSPSDMRFVFFVGVLRVENQNIAAAKKLDQASTLVGCGLFCVLRVQLISLCRVKKEFIRLVIRQKSN
jgi:hypothetical protein